MAKNSDYSPETVVCQNCAGRAYSEPRAHHITFFKCNGCGRITRRDNNSGVLSLVSK